MVKKEKDSYVDLHHRALSAAQFGTGHVVDTKADFRGADHINPARVNISLSTGRERLPGDVLPTRTHYGTVDFHAQPNKYGFNEVRDDVISHGYRGVPEDDVPVVVAQARKAGLEPADPANPRLPITWPKYPHNPNPQAARGGWPTR